MSNLIERGRLLLADARDRALREYGSAIGKRREELATPALVLDVDAARTNIERMATQLQSMPAGIRPHVKVHKSPDLARMQVEAGAVGLSAATVWEAVVMAAAGMDDLFVVNTVASPDKMRVLAELARERRVIVAVDDRRNAQELSTAARAASSVLGVMIEIDTGMDRCGADTPDQALRLAEQIVELPGLGLEGLTGYEGHCSLIHDRDLRLAKQQEAMAFFVGVADLFAANGIPCGILSAGGTATWEWTAANPRITEIQAGTYVLMDNDYGRMVSGFEHSLTVQTTVISVTPDRVVVDAGGKSVAEGELCSIVGHPYSAVRFDEEHGIFATPDGTTLRAGDAVQLIPGYAPSTVNWYDAYHVVQADKVVDVWPVVPRGPGHHGLVGG